MRLSRCTFALAIALFATVACARSSVRQNAYPVGPGLLDGRPEQGPGTYRVIGWVLSDHSGEPLSDVQVWVSGTHLGTRTDAFGRYFFPDVPADRDTIVVNRLGYVKERRVLARKAPGGLYICPESGCKFSYTDTLNFWLHLYPLIPQ